MKATIGGKKKREKKKEKKKRKILIARRDSREPRSLVEFVFSTIFTSTIALISIGFWIARVLVSNMTTCIKRQSGRFVGAISCFRNPIFACIFAMF